MAHSNDCPINSCEAYSDNDLITEITIAAPDFELRAVANVELGYALTKLWIKCDI